MTKTTHDKLSRKLSMPWLCDLVSLVCGALFPLGFSPFGFFVLPPIILAIFFYLLRFESPQRAFLRGWLFGLGLFGVGVSWVSESFQYNGIIWPITLGLTVLFICILSLFIGLVGWFSRRISTLNRAGDLCFLLPSVWLLSEWGRGEFLGGFTWLQLGYSQIDSPLIGYAPLVGTLGTGVAVSVSAGLLVIALTGPVRNSSWVKRGAALAGIAVIWVVGAALSNIHWTRANGPTFSVALIQGNIPQELKWQPVQRIPTVRHYIELTRTQPNADIVIWPEVALPMYFTEARELLQELGAEMRTLNTELLLGILVREDRRPYNSVVHLSESPRFYHKVHLVPFGEYLPLATSLNPLVRALRIPVSNFHHGEIHQPLFFLHGVKAAMTICYEIAFGDEVARFIPGAQMLFNVSNDAWFGDSLAPHQHLQMARMRSVETGRFLARATNTGISAVIDPQGRILARSAQFKTEIVVGDIQPMKGTTPYARWKDWPVFGFITLCLGGMFFRRYMPRR